MKYIYMHSNASYLDAGDTGTPVDRAHIKCLSAAKIRIYDQCLLSLQNYFADSAIFGMLG